MSDPEIIVIDIDLEIDIEQEILKLTQEMSKDTMDTIDKIASESKELKDKAQKKKNLEKTQKVQLEKNLDECYKLLKQATKHNPVMGEALAKQSEMTLSSLISKLNKRIPEKILKKKFMGKNSYYLESQSS